MFKLSSDDVNIDFNQHKQCRVCKGSFVIIHAQLGFSKVFTFRNKNIHIRFLWGPMLKFNTCDF